MDGQTFDDLIKATTQAPTRRGALGLLAGAALSGLARFDQTEAKKRKNKKKKKKKRGNGNVPPPPPPPPPPECVDDGDCDNDEICQNGTCVPEPECINDGDCGDNEACEDGACICPEVLQDRCVIRCDGGGDCPAGCDCRGLFPGDGQPRVVCVDDSALCGATDCDDSDDCDADEICAFASCGSPPAAVGRCFPVCVR